MRRILIVAALAAAFAPATARAADAELDRRVTLDMREVVAPKALEVLARSADINIVYEEANRTRAVTLSGQDRSLRETLNLIADATDTEWQRMSGIYVLVQRYSRWEDRPELSDRELRESLDDMWRVMTAVTAQPWQAGGRRQAEFLRSLTTEQRQAMAEGDLGYAGLRLEQQQLLTMIARDIEFSWIPTLETTRGAVHGLPAARIVWQPHVHPDARDDPRALVQFTDATSGRTGTTVISLSGPLINGVAVADSGREREAAGSSSLPKITPRIMVGPGARKPLGKKVTLEIRGLPLLAAAAQLEKAAGITVKWPREAGAPDKKVTAFLRDVDALAALDALTAIYDWQWKRVREGEYTVSRPPTSMPRRAEEVPGLLFRALPRAVRSTYLYDPGSARGQVPAAYLGRLMRDLRPALEQRTLNTRELSTEQRRTLRDGLYYRGVYELLGQMPAQVSPLVRAPERMVLTVTFADNARRSGTLHVSAEADGQRGAIGFSFEDW